MATGGVSNTVMRDLECPVCHEVFQAPKVLPCGHSLCASPCLQQLAGDQEHVKCPECRTAHPVPAGGVSNFPTNFFICRIVENTKSKVCLNQSRCSGCSADSVILRRCLHCANHICGVCRNEHTDIMKKDLVKLFAECSDEMISADSDLKEGTTMKLLEVKYKAIHDELNRVTESFHQIINKRKLELSQSIDDCKTVEVDKILAQRQKAKDSCVTFCKEKQLILDGDVSQSMLIQLEEEFFDTMEKFKLEENNTEISDTTLYVDEMVIAQSLSKFGEIKDNFVAEQTKAEVLDVPVVKAVPLDINRDFTKVKRCIGRQGAEPGLLNSPTAIQVSPVTGNIVVAGDKNKRIQIFSHQGEFIRLFTKPYDDHKSVKHLEISSKGEIVILGDNDSIASYDENGELIYDCSVKGAISLALAPNCDVHVGMKDSVLVMQQGIEMNSYFIGREQGRADRICIAKAGTIYVLQFTQSNSCKDNLKNCDTMFVFNRQFQLIQEMDFGFIYRTIQCGCSHIRHKNQTAPRGSWGLINDEYFLTTDPSSHSVTIYDLQWRNIKRIGSAGNTVGGLYYPHCAALTLDGDVVVVSDNHMMQFF